ncbi:DUF11 domain-containing protein [Bremerella cremea]|uniref:DUF11 domain-containing protein n=1 Tax=Bremerella cremea TaxID=1031537 RepID=A0A368KZ22_9BACT|nr:DUF11 domain-containing protein [Bremerella cremea]RCS56019.1 DUF11 domain-containing protein [Bremerella cremea]
MMHRSALLGTAGMIVLAAFGHVVISGITAHQTASAETNQTAASDPVSPVPSRFAAPSGSIPLQPMPARLSRDVSTSGTRLTAIEEEGQPSSRRRAARPEAMAPQQEPTPAARPQAGLPSSLDEALNRLKSAPVIADNEEDKTLEPAPAAPPQQEIEAPAALPNKSPVANSYRYQPPGSAPAANGAASIGSASPEPETQPQPAITPEPAAIPRQTLTTSDLPATAPIQKPVETPTGSLFTLSSPSIEIETSGPKSLVLGKPSNFRIHARNAGGTDARQVMVSMLLPQSVQLQDIRGTLGSPRQVTTQSGAVAVQWEIPVLPGRSEGHLDLNLIAMQTRPFELAIEVSSAPLQAMSPITVLEPKLAMAIDGPTDILFGDSQIFKVIAKNTGTGPAENVSITIMPIKKGQNPTVLDSIGTIEAGDQKVIELELTAKQAGTLQLRAETSAANGLMAQAAHDVLVRRAELAVSAQGPGIKYAATTANYQVMVANSGNAPASEIVVEAILPTGAKFLSASHGGTHNTNNNSVTWKLASLEAGTQQPLEVVSMLQVEGNNILQVTANANQGLTSHHELITRVESVADLKLAVNDPTGPIPVGQEVEYEFHLTNRGTKEAREVQVTVSFGSGIEPLSVDGGRGNIQGEKVQLTTIPSVNAGQEIVVKVKARGRSEGSHTFRAEVRCDDPTTRLAIEESTHFYGATIQTASPQMPARQQPPTSLAPPAAAGPTSLSPPPFSRYQ